MTVGSSCARGNSSHINLLKLSVRQKTLNDTGISITKDHGATRLAFHFLGTTAEIVLEKGGTATNFPRSGQTKTLFRPAFGFHFGHFILIIQRVIGKAGISGQAALFSLIAERWRFITSSPR
jgi:hypothetical protein